jgi:hypothetical protein
MLTQLGVLPPCPTEGLCHGRVEAGDEVIDPGTQILVGAGVAAAEEFLPPRIENQPDGFSQDIEATAQLYSGIRRPATSRARQNREPPGRRFPGLVATIIRGRNARSRAVSGSPANPTWVIVAWSSLAAPDRDAANTG